MSKQRRSHRNLAMDETYETSPDGALPDLSMTRPRQSKRKTTHSRSRDVLPTVIEVASAHEEDCVHEGTSADEVASADGIAHESDTTKTDDPHATADVAAEPELVVDPDKMEPQVEFYKSDETHDHGPSLEEVCKLANAEDVDSDEERSPSPSPRRDTKRRTSLAMAVTGSLLKGEPLPHISTDTTELAVEEFAAAGETIDQLSKRQATVNPRAKMGFWQLHWTDFKTWYRRWSIKNQEPVFLRASIDALESNFGSALGYFFRFQRTLLFINLLLTILWLGFVVIPTATAFPYHSLTGDFNVLNIIDGRGVVSKFYLFYGGYPQTIGSYHLGLAYLAMLLITYFGSLLYILASTVRGRTMESPHEEKTFRYCMLLWTSWDHSMTSKNGTTNLSRGITSLIHNKTSLLGEPSSDVDYINENKAAELIHNRTNKEKIRMYCFRALAWFITVILIVGGCTTIVYLVIMINVEEVLKNSSNKMEHYLLKVYSTAIIFSLINFFVAQCIMLLPKMEQYASGKEELYVTLARIITLRMANLYALIIALYKTITESSVPCAGNVIGQELYKLVIIDTVLHSTGVVLLSCILFVWKGERLEFNIPHTVLVMIYRQALIWTGTLACPLMPLVGLLSHFISFWAMYFVVSKTCKPPIKRWNQSRNSSVFPWFLLITLAILIPPMSVLITNADLVKLGTTDEPNKFCGPFGSGQPSSAYSHFASLQSSGFKYALELVTSATVLLPTFLVLLSLLIFQRIKLFTEVKRSAIFKAQINYERDQNSQLIRKIQIVNRWKKTMGRESEVYVS